MHFLIYKSNTCNLREINIHSFIKPIPKVNLNIYKNIAVIAIAYDIVVNIEKRIIIADTPRKHRDIPEIERITPRMHSSILI